MVRSVFLSLLLCTGSLPQTAIAGKDLALKSSGAAKDPSWVLTENGYVGTYIPLTADAAEVRVTVRAFGPGAHMNFAIDNRRQKFDVGGEAKDYSFAFPLLKGTHFLRIESTSGQPLTIDTVSVTAPISNEHSDANALAAADSYIENFRKGNASVKLEGVAANTPVHIKLRRHPFHFGVCLSLDDTAKLIEEFPPPDSDAAKYQKFVNAGYFNTIVAGNAGKWAYNEPEPGKVTMQTVDALL